MNGQKGQRTWVLAGPIEVAAEQQSEMVKPQKANGAEQLAKMWAVEISQEKEQKKEQQILNTMAFGRKEG